MRTSTMSLFYLLIAVVILFVSCSENNKTESVSELNPKFKIFLERIPSISLPVTISGCSVDTKNLALVENNYFVSEQGEIHAYGKLQLKDGCTAVILLAEADCGIPVVVTFDNQGNKIDEKEINIGKCGFDCGYSCSEIMQIDTYNNIYTADTISSYKCDSLGNAIPGTDEHYVLYKQGKIVETGKIELSGEIKKQL